MATSSSVTDSVATPRTTFSAAGTDPMGTIRNIVRTLREIGPRALLTLCQDQGHGHRESQKAIWELVEQGVITFAPDWRIRWLKDSKEES